MDAILPAELSELLCIKQSDPRMSYESFKGFVEGQAAQILMNSGRLPVNAVDEKGHDAQPSRENEEEGYGYDDQPDPELIAWVGRLFKKGKGKGKGSGQQSASNSQSRSARSDTQKPAKCSSCHGDHSTRDCTEPAVSPDKKTCLECNQPGHTARFCPNNAKGNGIKAVAERVASKQRPCFGLNDAKEEEVDVNGSKEVRRGTGPAHHAHTLGDFFIGKLPLATENRFEL